ncbi:hypothetical protein BD310DRAFT_938756 [Dichomitus squalens]|uniref:Uncharacterized protein n=1 Tax=Dichomitus squalens TaxID=114155 RepID=A0A4Q9PFT9_9APHY|nr:hypothetical protein BD310DRAFT_938756 [Dichomitus squalens]
MDGRLERPFMVLRLSDSPQSPSPSTNRIPCSPVGATRPTPPYSPVRATRSLTPTFPNREFMQLPKADTFCAVGSPSRLQADIVGAPGCTWGNFRLVFGWGLSCHCPQRRFRVSGSRAATWMGTALRSWHPRNLGPGVGPWSPWRCSRASRWCSSP